MWISDCDEFRNDRLSTCGQTVHGTVTVIHTIPIMDFLRESRISSTLL